MAETLLNIESISQYNDMLGVTTLNQQISVINLSKAKPMHHMRHTFSFYVVFLKDEKNCDLIYGRSHYDYQKGSVICLAPGQVIGIADTGETFQPSGYALCFHPSLISGSHLAKNIKEYTFFSYKVNEALHLSDTERHIFLECLHMIDEEINHTTDNMSRRLICNAIELLLNNCLRFYNRQFNTRQNQNTYILSRLDDIIDKYISNSNKESDGLPTVKYCASQLCLSTNYFGDLIKKESGKTALQYIQERIINIAKEYILMPENTINQVAYRLGFRYPQYFTRVFKKETGMTPIEYRRCTGNKTRYSDSTPLNESFRTANHDKKRNF